ncbi:unnamed protein product [Rotaria sp. Silwood2]|nr:unnamed protein product [Rotaria sp. Silwood2]CAF4734085.1 unnamed protein product [Rotaria sp. Silwood2]
MIVLNVDDLLKCLSFSLDCTASYSILQKQQIPLILNNNESDKQFLSNIHLQLECLSQSADEIYSQFITEKPKNM